VSLAQQTQSEASFAIDPTRPQILFGASNDTGGDRVRIYDSSDGGASWRRSEGRPSPTARALPASRASESTAADASTSPSPPGRTAAT
jgi:hypothetical protein